MYLKKLKIWNFRRISTSDDASISPENPGASIDFNPNLNIIVGENNSGKTTIIDAIRLVLGTHSQEYFRLDELDFHHNGSTRAQELRIELIFSGLSDAEAGDFLEWIGMDEGGNYELRIWLQASIQDDNRVIYNIRSGADEIGIHMENEAKQKLWTTYLKPLRDADAELSPGYKSRLAQILINNPIFRKEFDDEGSIKPHALEKYVKKANDKVKDYFSLETLPPDSEYELEEGTIGGGSIKNRIDAYLETFFHIDDSKEAKFSISDAELIGILRKLRLSLDENKAGLGELNQLFIATELLLLQDESYRGLKLALIEEIEAHLHPQAQLRLIGALDDALVKNNSQFILTTHSTTLASKVKLENLILCYEGKAYSLAADRTKLEKEDYAFLERFLDATKANLFFAKGVILVEGDAENILIPTIAEIIDRPLHRYGVSIVNVGSTAFLRYAKIFHRSGEGTLPIKVSIVTDMDIEQVEENGEIVKVKHKKEYYSLEEVEGIISTTKAEIEGYFNSSNDCIKTFISPLWTMEYDLSLGKLRNYMNRAVSIAQLINSRNKRKDFSSISEKEETDRKKSADTDLVSWEEEGLNDKMQAYKIYKRLKNGSASKAVAAQWLARILKEELATDQEKEVLIKKILKTDIHVKYIIDAICHVTKGLGDD